MKCSMSFWDCQWKEAHGIDLVCAHAERFPDGDVPRMGIDFDEVGSLAHILDIKSVSEFFLIQWCSCQCTILGTITLMRAPIV